MRAADTYYIAGQVINQLEDTVFFCNQDEFGIAFNSTQACEECEAAGADAPPVCVDHVRRANDNASACGYCLYTTGGSFLVCCVFLHWSACDRSRTG